MTISTIRLELARDHDFPQGSSEHGYVLKAPLTDEGRLDAAEWRKNRKACEVRRFWVGEEDLVGHLHHNQGGTWIFHYDVSGDTEEDEPGYKFGDHLFKEGEYVSVLEHDGVMRTFRVTAVARLVV